MNLATPLSELLLSNLIYLVELRAAKDVTDVIKEEAPPEVNFLTVWHFLEGLPN